ncbi:MAG TPA: glycosyltransferase 87 family protein [Jiangellaceae bacterium]
MRRRSEDRSPLRDGRSIVLGCVALYLSVVTGLRALWDVDIWPWLGVPSGPSIFFDARNVAAAVECSQLGYDPLTDNPCDPWDRVMFYPRVWLLLRVTGLEQRHTVLFGAVVIILFVLSLLLLLPRLGVAEGLVVAAAACSPAVMFAVERANMDLVIFSGLALAAVVWRRSTATAESAAVAIVLLMAVAKLYPAVALLAFLLARRRGTRTAAGAAMLVFAAYVVVTRDDVVTISTTATQGQYYSYGARILLGRVYHSVVGDQWGGSRALAQVLVLLAVVLLALGMWLWLRHRSHHSPTAVPLPETADLIAFRMGSLIYVGTFVIGNSFDYRLVFLLLTLPLLLRWPDPPRIIGNRLNLPLVTVAVVVVALWIGTLSQQLRLADELVSWTVAGLLVVLLIRSAPQIGALFRSGRASG